MEIINKGAWVTTIVVAMLVAQSCNTNSSGETKKDSSTLAIKEDDPIKKTQPLDTADYDRRMLVMSNGDTSGKWPTKPIYPLPGAIFPYNRVVAYYGNLYSKRMGILGELPKYQMLAKLKGEVANWQKADTSIPVMPALHYVAVTAQSNGGKQRMRMPFHQIDTIISWAKEINALVFLDIQVGWSTLQEEVPELEKYLKMPNVHLGIDPEFSMKFGDVPGKRIGTFNADDVNYTVNYLSDLVKKNNLPPKILVVHRFTQGMLTNAMNIKPTPEVQVLIDMDGWGDKILKKSSWLRYIKREPVQFAGFKLFYKNDTKKDKNGLYTPEELLQFTPKPIYIQYQ